MSGFFDTLSKRDGETDKKRFIIGGTVAVAFLHNNPGLHITTHTYLSGFVTFKIRREKSSSSAMLPLLWRL
jgi:hypothetical protein